jgi:hypothetical protein
LRQQRFMEKKFRDFSRANGNRIFSEWKFR